MNYYEISEENENLFNEVLDATSTPQFVDFKLIGDNNLNKVCDIKKNNALVEYIDGNHLTVFVNEDIFDKLPPEQQKLVFEEELSLVNVNPDNDKIKVIKYDVNTNSGFLRKYGNETVITLQESILALFQQKKEMEEELKASRKKKKSTEN